ncbi:MAG: 50S ribosomal protein L22 [Candidatus Pacebacteria bacterium]|nr:50S ribosomal protein L22 [Candidatus Paceibacterota bacterium]
MITASLKNTRIAPRKVRVVADMIRGKSVVDAQTILGFAAKKARHPISVLIDSAVANASHNFKIGPEGLIVKEIRVDQGFVMKRSMPVSRGSAHPIALRTSHILVVLAPGVAKKSKKTVKKATAKK